jgi:ribosomal protein S30
VNESTDHLFNEAIVNHVLASSTLGGKRLQVRTQIPKKVVKTKHDATGRRRRRRQHKYSHLSTSLGPTSHCLTKDPFSVLCAATSSAVHQHFLSISVCRQHHQINPFDLAFSCDHHAFTRESYRTTAPTSEPTPSPETNDRVKRTFFLSRFFSRPPNQINHGQQWRPA